MYTPLMLNAHSVLLSHKGSMELLRTETFEKRLVKRNTNCTKIYSRVPFLIQFINFDENRYREWFILDEFVVRVEAAVAYTAGFQRCRCVRRGRGGVILGRVERSTVNGWMNRGR